MKRPWLGLLFLPAFLPGFIAHQYPQPDFAGLVVLVSHDQGHGSGSYLGNGYVLTANHVIDSGTPIEVMDDRQRTYKAEIISTDAANDVALLRIAEDAPIEVAHMACRAPRLGEAVSASGNPFSIQFITMWGRVAGLPRDNALVLTATVLDITILPGMSGGPVQDWWGDIIGINTATMQIASGMMRVPVPIGYSVPSTRICPLLYKAGVI